MISFSDMNVAHTDLLTRTGEVCFPLLLLERHLTEEQEVRFKEERTKLSYKNSPLKTSLPLSPPGWCHRDYD